MFSRRMFLKTFIPLVLALDMRAGRAAASLFFRPSRKEPRIERGNTFTGKDGRALIGVSGRDTPKEMIREAVSLIGGFERLDPVGKTVLVKPNVVSGEPNPSTTNPEVVAALVEILYEEGAKKVYVGDMSALITLSTKRNMRKSGIEAAAKGSGAETVAFEDFDWVEVDLPENTYVKRAYVTEWLYRTDLFINVPVIKTHRSATYSITIKNFIGCTHLKQRPYFIDRGHWEEVVAEFGAAASPDLNIVDGTVSMVEGGPWSGTARKTGLVIASGDRVGADVVGIGIIKSFGLWPPLTGTDPWEVRQIKRALELGLGRDVTGLRLLAGGGDGEFMELMEKTRALTGL